MDNLESQTVTDVLGSISTGTFQADYEFLETIGKGGHGEVYKVVSKRDNQTYAVKKVRFDQHRDRSRIHLLKRELINNAKLSHENVVRYYDSWIEVSADQSLGSSDWSDSETDYSGDQRSSESVFIDSATKEVDALDIRNAEAYSSTKKSRLDQKRGTSHEYAAEESMTNVAFENTSLFTETGINKESLIGTLKGSQFKAQRPSSTDTEAADDTKCSDDAPSKVKDIDDNADTEDEVFDEDEIEEDITQTLKQDAAKLNEILMQVSSSDRKGGFFEQLSKSDSEYFEKILEATNESGPRYLDLFIKMEFCDKTLRDAIDNDELVDNDERVWNYFRQIVRGLNYIHSKGITQDLNPNNIFIANGDIVKIGDFGLSRFHSNDEFDLDKINVPLNSSDLDKSAKSGMTGNVGTVWYSAPEVFGKPPCVYGHEIDLFSLGLVFFEMCHKPLSTGHEKMEIFKKLRNEAILPQGFDTPSKTKQANIIVNLLRSNPAERVPLKKLMDPSEGLVEPEPEEEHHFRIMLPEVIAKPSGELYQLMVHHLFQPRESACLTPFPCQTVTKQVALINNTFSSIALSNGVTKINLPLLLPAKGSCEPMDESNMFIDSEGQLVLLSASSLRSFVYGLQNNMIPANERNTFYTSQPVCRPDPCFYGPDNNTNIHYFSISKTNDMVAIAKAALILQQCIKKSNSDLTDDSDFDVTQKFVLCLSHADIDFCLVKLYSLGETEQKIINTLFDQIGGSRRRQQMAKLLKKYPHYDFSLPVDLMGIGSVEKMSNRISRRLKYMQKTAKGSSIVLIDRAHNSLNFIKDLADVMTKIGVTFEMKIENFITSPQEGATENGIKFRLRSKSDMQIVARGCEFRIDKGGCISRREFLWYELDSIKLGETYADDDKTEVAILYQETNLDEAKDTAYLYRKLVSVGFSVSTASRLFSMRMRSKFLILFNDEGTVAVYCEGTKMKRIPMKVQTVANHLEQRKQVRAVTWAITDDDVMMLY